MYRLLIVAILLLAINLRVPLLSVTPLLQFIRIDYGFSNSVAGLLTALPLLVFAVTSSFMAGLSQRFGVGRVIVLGILTIIAGELIRSFGGVYGLFFGTVIIAFGIVAGNVLIPALIRGFFPTKMGLMTSCYSAIMQVSTTVALLTAVPISRQIGWAYTLLLLVVLAFIALVYWLPFKGLTFDCAYSGYKSLPRIFGEEERPQAGHKVPMKVLYKQALAWDVSLFMGIQSIMFYCVSTWLPTIVTTKGYDAAWGGYMGFVFQLTSLVVTFIVPLIVSRLKEQKWAATFSCILYGIGIAGLFTLNDELGVSVSVVLAGIGAGATFAIALMYFVMRTKSAMASATLSGVGQAIGYVLASVGPVFIGFLYDWEGSWYSTMIFLLVFCFLFGVTGYRAGADKKLEE